MSAPYDPLGRIAAQETAPYDHPAVSITGLERYWQGVYAESAGSIVGAALPPMHSLASQDVEACEAALTTAVERVKHLHGGAGTWQTDNERIEAAAERDALFARLARLVGRRDALAAELARRSGS